MRSPVTLSKPAFAMDMHYGLPEKRFNEAKSFFRDVIFVNPQTFVCQLDNLFHVRMHNCSFIAVLIFLMPETFVHSLHEVKASLYQMSLKSAMCNALFSGIIA